MDEQHDTETMEMLAVRVTSELVERIEALVPKLGPAGVKLTRADAIRHVLTLGITQAETNLTTSV